MNKLNQVLSLALSIVAVVLCLGAYSGTPPPDVPIGSIVAWHKSLAGVPNLPPGWVECAGGTVSDSRSPLNGQSIPDLNNNSSVGRFVKGYTSSGQAGGSSQHSHPYAGSTEIEDADTDVQAQVTSPATVAALAHIHSYEGTTDPASSEPQFITMVYIMRIK